LLGPSIADENGNLVFRGTSQNFNTVMATAADVVIVEPKKMVKTGEILPENVQVPGMLVDYILEK
jgi:acetate CoA/acetoacetate CoA-transferase alpha subunit